MNNLTPELDGVEFINCYTKGKTRLGRLLTNLSDIAIDHPVYGRFRSAEGLYYYLKTGGCHESLRSMSGFEAKRYGSKLPVVWMKDFREQFQIALKNKILNHPELKELFIASTLPFVHFYVYESKRPDVPPKVIVPRDSVWIMEFLTEFRKELQSIDQ